MREAVKIVTGLSLSSLYRGIRFGWGDMVATARRTTRQVSPLESSDLHQIPAVPLDTILTGRQIEISLSVEAHTDGTLPNHEALALTALVKADPAVMFEIGTFMGKTTRLLAANLPGTLIHTLDLPPGFDPKAEKTPSMPKDDFHLIDRRDPGHHFINSGFADRIRQHYGDSATWDFQQAGGATCFFIDGSHTYEYCRSDSEKCYDLCGGKGTFIWHDCNYDHPGVARLLAEWRKKGRDVVRIADTSIGYWTNV